MSATERVRSRVSGCDPAEQRFRRAEAAVSVHVGTTATAAANASAGRRFGEAAVARVQPRAAAERVNVR